MTVIVDVVGKGGGGEKDILFTSPSGLADVY